MKNGISNVHQFNESSYEFWYKGLKDAYKDIIKTEKTDPLTTKIICKSQERIECEGKHKIKSYYGFDRFEFVILVIYNPKLSEKEKILKEK